MSIEENSVDQNDIDLDTFSADFFGQSNATPQEEANSEASEEGITDDANINDDTVDTQEGDDTPDDVKDEDEDGEQSEEIDDEPKPKQTRAQERIEELNRKYREEQRQREALEARLAALEQKGKTEAPAHVDVTDTAPHPDDKNEDGTDKYPLGEYDPAFIRDQVTHAFEQKHQELLAREQEEADRQEQEDQRAQLQAEWNDKLVPARERYPDFQEKGQNLVSAFEGIDPNYGEYLTTTLMNMEFGPDVLYYLANNMDEAHKIVQSGAAKATVALGRLEAKFAFANEEKQKARPKVSQAPTPPPANRGSAVAKPSIEADTDNLDDFEREFFKKARR